jgi:DNA-binding response OmpR family regulator
MTGPVPRDKTSRRRILVVEPDREFRRILHDFFSHQRFEVARAGDGDEALDKAEAFKPDIILLSRELPMHDGTMGPDGLRVLKILKQDRNLTNLPVILTSAVAAEGDFDRYRKLKFAADDYIRKPFEDTEILRRVENLIGFDLSDGEDLNQIKAKIENVVRSPAEADFFHAETDAIGPSMSAATRREITQLLEQVGAELDRQETPASTNGAHPPPPELPPPPAPPAPRPGEDAALTDLREHVAELKRQLERVRHELQEERKRSKELKREWKKKLTDIAGRLRESEDREAEIRDEFETMRQRFADLELDHTLELEREKETRRRVEEELLDFRKKEREYPRATIQDDLMKTTELLAEMLRRFEPPED